MKVEQVPQASQGDQVPIVGVGNQVPVVPPAMTNGGIREILITLVRSSTSHVNMYMTQRVNLVESTMISRLNDSVLMNNPIFLGSME